MLKKKSASREKKRKHSQSEEQHDNRKRRNTDSSVEQDSKDDLDRIGSDIEEGGLDLNTPFQPISAFMSDRREMLEQCFHVLGTQKLQKMLPDELKSCTLEEIKTLCWSQLEQVSERNLLQILGGEELTSGDAGDNKEVNLESQQDNNVDSTSSLKDAAKSEDNKQEAGGSGDESDVLSINADASDSDMELPKEDQAAKSEGGAAAAAATATAPPAAAQPSANPEPAGDGAPAETRKELQKDIDRSVSEILASASGAEEADGGKAPAAASASTAACSPAQSSAAAGLVPAVCQPSVQQLELLELEMRARAIKALMKAGDARKGATGPVAPKSDSL